MATTEIGSLFIVTAASGTGKTSLVKQLIEQTSQLNVSISHTTRQPRPGEVNGTDYHFTTVEDFKAGIEQNKFVEYAEVFGNYYGTSADSVNQQRNAGNDVILEIDWQGALQVKKQFDDAQMIFILPPSKEALRERLSNRGQDSAEVIESRLAGSITEMQQFNHFDFIIINDDFEIALTEMKAIIIANRQQLQRQTLRNSELISHLLAD